MLPGNFRWNSVWLGFWPIWNVQGQGRKHFNFRAGKRSAAHGVAGICNQVSGAESKLLGTHRLGSAKVSLCYIALPSAVDFDSSNKHGASIACLSMTPKAEPRRRVNGTYPVRVLVVEDFVPFRQFILSMLASMPDLRVIGEVSDGLEAVHKSAEQQPDLILLDIGLPSLNGIEAARRIRALVPESKIIFLSQESSADVIEEALNTGARGYVVKTQAEGQLLATIHAAISNAVPR